MGNMIGLQDDKSGVWGDAHLVTDSKTARCPSFDQVRPHRRPHRQGDCQVAPFDRGAPISKAMTKPP